MSNAVARYHILSEKAVRESGLAWTFLQPNSFMSNTLQWVPQLSAGGKNGESGLLKPSPPEKKLCWSLTAGCDRRARKEAARP